MDVANQTTPNFRADMNNALQALASNSLGTAAPTTAFPGMWWIDTTAGYLKQRNTANNAWVIVAKIDTDMLAALQTQTFTGYDAAGTAPTFTITPAPTLTAYAAKQRFRVKFNGAVVTGTPTLNVNALGAKNLKQYDASGTKVTAVIAANQIADCEYDGTDFVVLDPLPAIVSQRGDISGLVPSNNSGAPTTTVDMSAGSCRDATDAYNLSLAATFSKRINATFTAGSGNGGLDAGTVAANTWYHVFLIRKDSDGSSDILLSTSFTTPTMPSGYTAKRVIHSIHTDASALIEAFISYETAGGGLCTMWTTPTLEVDSTTTTSARTDTVKTPPGYRTFAILNVMATRGSTGIQVFVGCPDTTDSAVSLTAAPLPSMGVAASGATSMNVAAVHRVLTNTSAQVRSRTDQTTSAFRISTQGFESSRR